jgi:hypothetical protein
LGASVGEIHPGVQIDSPAIATKSHALEDDDGTVEFCSSSYIDVATLVPVERPVSNGSLSAKRVVTILEQAASGQCTHDLGLGKP